MSSSIKYVDVILPLALPQAYTYAVSVDIADFVQIGHRVIVQFGKNKFYTAIVKEIHHRKPAIEAKLVETIADEFPVVTANQLRFWKWIAEYYMCTEGEVMLAALPTGLRLSSETNIHFNDGYEGDFESLNNDEFLIVQALRAQRELTIPKIQSILQKKNVYPFLKTLFQLGIAMASEEIIQKYKPKTDTYVRLNESYQAEDALQQLYDELSRAPKQVELLLAFKHLSKENRYVRKKDLLQKSGADSSVFKRLCEKHVFTEYKVEVSRFGRFQTDEITTPELSSQQENALSEIKNHFTEKQVVLLHGVTGSGKTEVYMELIAAQLAEGKQVLYMLPEIALTAQIINRLRKYFGEQIGIYHSKFNLHERVEIWNKVLNNEFKLIVSARSGIFLPFQDLGLIIVDEEHDLSFKQIDPAPRYQARDAAIVLANYFQAKVLLGTATPSLESFYNAEKGKYAKVEMNKRFADIELPEIILQQKKSAFKEQEDSFSSELIKAIEMRLKEKEQVILFVNRRGHSQFQICKTCSYIYKCKHCDVSLVYHKFQNRLVCHYCGYIEKPELGCKNCGAIDLAIQGLGTEKIEEEIEQLFPQAKVGRLDLDTTRSKYGHEEVIAKFENREIDILVGTQMVTKGLDFDHVSLVGVVNADMLLYFPGYKSAERAFQLLTQVSGRAGRKNKRGTVIIQSAKPENPIFSYVVQGNYRSFYLQEINHRRSFNYPPFSRLVNLKLKSKNIQRLEELALFLVNNMKAKRIGQVLGPSTPFVSKINNFYLREILIKTDGQTNDLNMFKSEINASILLSKEKKEWREVIIQIDVDMQ